MEQKITIQQKLEMQNYVKTLRTKLQEREKGLAKTCEDNKERELAKLQDEITVLAQMYRHYYYNIAPNTANKSRLGLIDEIEQLEKILTAAKAQMIEGQIDRERLIEVTKLGRKNMLSICKVGNIGQYADLLLEEQKEQEER